jgi:hypothetical protein
MLCGSIRYTNIYVLKIVWEQLQFSDLFGCVEIMWYLIKKYYYTPICRLFSGQLTGHVYAKKAQQLLK